MDELLEMLKSKLEKMRRNTACTVEFDFCEVSQMYQVVCMMKQIREIAEWSDKGCQ